MEIGNVIRLVPIKNTEEDSTLLRRTPSVYYYKDIVFSPNPEREYIVCDEYPKGQFLLRDKDNHDLPIGFCLLFIDNLPHIIITQIGFEPIPVLLEITGKSDIIPSAHRIGSEVLIVDDKEVFNHVPS